MRASAIVMANPLTKDSSQMRCVEWDDIVQTFATDGSNQAFTMSVGGRHANGRFQDVDAPAPNLTIQTSGESLVPIMKNKLAVLIAWKRVPQLLKCPFGREMFGYVEVFSDHRVVGILTGSGMAPPRRCISAGEVGGRSGQQVIYQGH
jgi:hypothetical protein